MTCLCTVVSHDGPLEQAGRVLRTCARSGFDALLNTGLWEAARSIFHTDSASEDSSPEPGHQLPVGLTGRS